VVEQFGSQAEPRTQECDTQVRRSWLKCRWPKGVPSSCRLPSTACRPWRRWTPRMLPPPSTSISLSRRRGVHALGIVPACLRAFVLRKHGHPDSCAEVLLVPDATVSSAARRFSLDCVSIRARVKAKQGYCPTESYYRVVRVTLHPFHGSIPSGITASELPTLFSEPLCRSACRADWCKEDGNNGRISERKRAP
jgi:hypothetical protein